MQERCPGCHLYPPMNRRRTSQKKTRRKNTRIDAGIGRVVLHVDADGFHFEDPFPNVSFFDNIQSIFLTIQSDCQFHPNFRIFSKGFATMSPSLTRGLMLLRQEKDRERSRSRD